MATWAELIEYFNLIPATAAVDMVPRYNVAPSQPVPAIRLTAAGRELAILRWGFIPSWSKDGKIAPINAMSESVGDKPMFRSAFKKRRCLLPATGFYEWARVGKKKQPIHFRLRSGQPFGFAGIWETWHGPEEGEIQETCAILTTEPNDLVRPVHNRMPVILQAAQFEQWLDPAVQDAEALKPLLRTFPAAEMEAVPVGDYVNNARHEGRECLASPGGAAAPPAPELPFDQNPVF